MEAWLVKKAEVSSWEVISSCGELNPCTARKQPTAAAQPTKMKHAKHAPQLL
jgi:hypothetical protein